MVDPSDATEVAPRKHAWLWRGGLLVLYLGVALLPWFIVNAQQRLSMHGRVDLLWPYFTIFGTFPHAVTLLALWWAPAWFPRWALPHRNDPLVASPRLRFAAGIVLYAVLALAALFLLRHYRQVLWWYPINPFHGDMLPLMEGGLREFWREGAYPYHAFNYYPIAHWSLPLTYTPGMWLSFSPAYLLNLDIRTWCLASAGVLALLLPAWGTGRAVGARSWEGIVAGLLAAAVALLPLWLDAFAGFLHALHLAGYWLFLVSWALAALHGRWFAAGLFFGICLISRPFFVILLPYYFLFSLHRWHAGDRPAAWLPWAGMIAPGLIGMAFFLYDPRAFTFGILDWYQAGSDYLIDNNRALVHGLGFSGLLWEMGDIYDHKMKIALGLQAVLLAASWWRLRDARGLVRTSAVALFFFLYFSIIPWFYIYVGPLLLLALTPPEFAEGESAAPPALDAVARRWLGIVLPAALLIVAGVFALHAFRPARHLPTPPAGTEDRDLLKARFEIAGLERAGWIENAGRYAQPITAPNIYVALPAERLDWRRLTLHLRATENRTPELRARLWLNMEPLPARPIEAAPELEMSWDIPRDNLFIGNNLVRIQFLTGPEDEPYEWSEGTGLQLSRVFWDEGRPWTEPPE